MVNVLTGFKYIAQSSENEEAIPAEKRRDYRRMSERTGAGPAPAIRRYFVFGGEESYGYLAQDFVRDKDANSAAIIFAELAAYAESAGKSLLELLHELFEELASIWKWANPWSWKVRTAPPKCGPLRVLLRQSSAELDGVPVTHPTFKGDMVGVKAIHPAER